MSTNKSIIMESMKNYSINRTFS